MGEKMKRMIFFVPSIIIIFICSFSSQLLALPEGVVARLGRGSVNQVTFSPDGKMLAVASSIGVWLYDSITFSEIGLIETGTIVNSISFNPDGTAIAGGGEDGAIRIWEVNSRKLIRMLKGHTDRVSSVAFSTEDALLASGSDDGTIKLWEVNSGSLIKTLDGHSSFVNSVAFSPDGSMFASGGGIGDETIKLWDTKSKSLVRGIEWDTKWANSVAFSPDGSLLASGDDYGQIALWEVKSGKCIRTFQGHGDRRSVNSVAFSPDSRMLVSGSNDETIKLWEVNSERCIRTLENIVWVNSVAFSPDGSMLASGSEDDTIILWDIKPYIKDYLAHQPEISLSEKNHDFGDAFIGKYADWSFGISNTGDAELLVKEIASDNSDLKVISPSFPQTISTKGSINITTRFSPTKEGIYSGNITINSSDPNESSIQMSLIGKGIKMQTQPSEFLGTNELIASPVDDSKTDLTDVESEDFLPLTKGSYWIYSGVTKWTEGTEVVEKTLTWKMEVIDTINFEDTTIAIMKGHPNDLAWYEEGTDRSDYLIIRRGTKFYKLDGQGMDKIMKSLVKEERPDVDELITENNLLLDLPLTPGKRFGDPEQVNRPDNSYCWFVEAKDQIELKNVKGISSPGKITRCRLIFQTGPDHTVIEYVPGIGIIGYIYNHHGTVSETDLKLIEYGKERVMTPTGKPAVEFPIANTETKPASKITPENAAAIIEMAKGGRIVIEFYPKDAPSTVSNFIKLADKEFYNGLKFHRVVNDPGGLQIIQGGDPLGNGTGGPGYTIKAEFNSRKHLAGTMAMARADDPDSAGSQFYICLAPQPFLNNNYTVFGQVVEGMDIAKGINEGDIMEKVTIVNRASIKK